MMPLKAEYNRDFYQWIDRHVELLKTGRIAELDVNNLIDELESMAKRDRRELVSHLAVLLRHLLKWEFQPEQRGSSWKGSIKEQRLQIEDQLADSPSLKNYLPEAITKAYPKAVDVAQDETDLAASVFPETCLYSVAQLLDKAFYPQATNDK
jgi:hypothetical protein